LEVEETWLRQGMEKEAWRRKKGKRKGRGRTKRKRKGRRERRRGTTMAAATALMSSKAMSQKRTASCLGRDRRQ
jgi:hypothetical protein